VKARTRDSRTETVSTTIFREAGADRQKLLDACEAFRCDPWIAVYVERDASADLFLTSLANYDRKYGSKEKRAIEVWRMTSSHRARYSADPKVRHIHMTIDAEHWP